jgi:hypothetical protein
MGGREHEGLLVRSQAVGPDRLRMMSSQVITSVGLTRGALHGAEPHVRPYLFCVLHDTSVAVPVVSPPIHRRAYTHFGLAAQLRRRHLNKVRADVQPQATRRHPAGGIIGQDSRYANDPQERANITL